MYAIVFLAALLSSPQQPVNKHVPPEHKQQQSATDSKEKTFATTSANTPIQQPSPTNQTDQNQQSTSGHIYRVEVVPQSPDRWFKGYVVFIALIAALNVGILFLMWLQRNAMLSQVKEMEEARKQDRKMAQLEYRAWIQFDSINFATADRGELQVTVGLLNAGRTPAKNIKVIWVVEDVHSRKPNFDYTPNTGAAARPVFPPQATMMLPITTTYGLTRQLWSDMEQGKRFIFAHGKVTYDDVFGDHHWMTFCQEFSTKLNRFAIYDEYNETDD